MGVSPLQGWAFQQENPNPCSGRAGWGRFPRDAQKIPFPIAWERERARMGTLGTGSRSLARR